MEGGAEGKMAMVAARTAAVVEATACRARRRTSRTGDTHTESSERVNTAPCTKPRMTCDPDRGLRASSRHSTAPAEVEEHHAATLERVVAAAVAESARVRSTACRRRRCSLRSGPVAL